jgi:Fe2+ or Zn2+ uptake regulation protein
MKENLEVLLSAYKILAEVTEQRVNMKQAATVYRAVIADIEEVLKNG